ncbi:hypothetical protein A2U01_0054218, partial [Trifolium medium]|nr:hypothetical protein [Trifolium medium]
HSHSGIEEESCHRDEVVSGCEIHDHRDYLDLPTRHAGPSVLALEGSNVVALGECDPASCSAVVDAPRKDVVVRRFRDEEVSSSDYVSAGESYFFVDAGFFPLRRVSSFAVAASHWFA